MRLGRHDPIAIPLGHVEEARASREVSHLHHSDRAIVGVVVPDRHVLARGEQADWSLLDRPTVTRRTARSIEEAVRLYLLEKFEIDDADAAAEIVALLKTGTR